MLFEKKLMPDYRFPSFTDITPEFLKSIGAEALISDIDNTLLPYEVAEATDEIVAWANALSECGTALTFVSNNNSDRVEKFNERLGFPAFADVHKPSTKYLKKAIGLSGVPAEKTLFLGDQLLTDALAAHRAGMRAAIVPPIKDKTNLFFKIKRLIEKPYLRKFDCLHVKNNAGE